MKKKKLIISLVIVVVVFLLVVCSFFVFLGKGKILDIFSNIFDKNQNIQKELSSEEIMGMIKTDKDYNDLSKFIKDFDPEVVSYIKLGSDEYKKVKPEWQKQGFEDRITAVDKINLTDFCYWIELKDKKDETKGLRTILDVKEKKSLLLIASLSIKAGIGL